MLRRSTLHRAVGTTTAAAAAASGSSSSSSASGGDAKRPIINSSSGNNSFDVVVVGGGLTGCLVASRIAMENLNVLMVEEGCNISKQPKWHRQLGCAQLLHRYAKRGYEKYIPTPPQKLWSDSTQTTDKIVIPAPMVLGGSGVMGGRSWIFGDQSDWENIEGLPWSFRNDVLPRIQRMESKEAPGPHRGKYGRFPIAKSIALSPVYKPFSEAMHQHVPLTSDFNRIDMTLKASCGRPELFLDANENRRAHQTLDSYVGQALQLKRPLHVKTDTRIIEITGNGKGAATGVKFMDKDGSVQRIDASVVILAGGAVGSSRLMEASSNSIGCKKASSSETTTQLGNGQIGQGFWDTPSVVLQYEMKERSSHNCYMSPFVQALGYVECMVGMPPLAASSAYDDLVAFWSSTGSSTAAPDVKFTIQPFTMSVTGERPANVPHGFQIIAQLMRPKSRGVITSSVVDPKYFTEESDREALAKAVDLVRNAVKQPCFSRITNGAPVAELFESRGVCGGGLCLGSVVDESSFLVKGSENVYVCDSSLLPRPLIGDRTPALLALADKFADRYLNKQDVTAKLPNTESLGGSGEVRIVY